MAELTRTLPNMRDRDGSVPVWQLARKSPAHSREQSYLIVKRGMDIVVASVALVILAPLLALVALAIKIDSHGPVLFLQERMGYDRRRRVQKEFTIFKFRSMAHKCDQTVHERVVAEFVNGKPPAADELAKPKYDRRVTRVGRMLRATSLDELPQLLNVFRGEMSLVGPRPVPLYEVAQYKPWHWQRLEAVPGITCLWQVELRGQSGIDDMVNLDVKYIQEQSLATDLRILARTVGAVVSGRGAV
jgi:lipopolysaccharide/colanic/teichoic acid biosynthesis glycosyltransferase